MKSKKIFVLVSSLALLLGACNKPASTSQSQSGSESANPTTSETSNTTSQGGQTEVAVTALAINKQTLSLEEGKSETLTVTVTPNNASNTKVTWESSDATVATVSSLGKVTAVKVGTATITVKSQSNPTVTATCAVTVTEEGGKYGSVNKPKTVAQILAIAAEECKNKDDKTADVVYVKGIVTKAPTTNAEKGFSRNIYLKDALTDEKDLWVYTANHDALKTPYQNDEVVLHGYLMNYNGTIEISNVKVDGVDNYPAIDNVTRGTSTITYNVEHGSVNADAPKSAKNNSEFSFKVTPEQGYKVDRVTVNGDAVTADDNGAYKAYVKGNTIVNIDISQEGVEIKTAEMAYPGGPNDSDTKNMVEGNNAATVGLDASVFEVTSTNTTGIYAGLNKAGEIRLYDNRKAEDVTQIANGTTLTVSSRKVTITKIVIELTSASAGDMEVKAGNQVVTGNNGTYQIDNGQFSIQNVSRIEGGASAAGKQVIIKKVTISYTENAAIAATAIAVAPKELTLKPGQTGVLAATLTPANATDTISWKSSDETKATVDASGTVTAVAQGNATVTAFIDANNNGQADETEIKDTAAVTVEAAEVINYGTAEAPLTIAEAKAVLEKTGTNKVTPQPMFVKGVISTNKAFNTQYHNGEVWLQSDDGQTAKDFELWSCEIDASLNYSGDPAADELKGYEVVATGYGEKYNSTYELTNFTPEGGTRINPKIISMTRQEVAATAIAVAPTTAEVEVGKTVDLAATLTPTNSTQKVAWKSSDEAKATVNAGKVTGVAEGNVTITAFVDADKDGVLDEGELKAECAVTVKAASTARAELPYTGNVASGSLPEGWTGSGAAFASSYYALKSNGAYAQAVALFAAQSKIKVDVKGICNGTSNDSTVTVYGLGDDGNAIQGVSATYTPDKASATNAAAVEAAATVKSVTLEGTGITGVKVELTTKGHNYVLVSFAISVVA